MIPVPFDYAAPRTVDEAVELLGQHAGAVVLAGGQLLLAELKLRRSTPPRLVDLRQIPGLRGISRHPDGGLSIGAMTTCAELVAHADVRAGARALVEAARVLGDVQVRNRATLGGNLACGHPAADLPAALLALEATIHVAGPGGRREIAADQFFVAPFHTALKAGELITEVRLPAPPASSGSVYEKFSHSHFYPLCGVAALVSLTEKGTVAKCRVAVTGVSLHPLRLRSLEAALDGQAPNASNIAAAAGKAGEGVIFVTDPFASNEYREHLTTVLAERVLARAVGLAAPPKA
ncbi:xanthine dehydrogenase family protein subunit M [Archangium sp.]|jgi:carbon-monoxide dehydrogenase medium subunit|uniref:FAD binding domain-containing protein n=1 Tax=Archangium sp. TaxID=1872627 RepID=UPI002EDA2272